MPLGLEGPRFVLPTPNPAEPALVKASAYLLLPTFRKSLQNALLLHWLLPRERTSPNSTRAKLDLLILYNLFCSAGFRSKRTSSSQWGEPGCREDGQHLEVAPSRQRPTH